MARNIFLLRLGLWLVIESAILIFAVIAAWRHKRSGLWFLAAAVILAISDDVLHMLWTEDFLVRHENTTVYLVLLHFGSYAIMVVTLCGWAVLAFSRTKREKSDAELGAAPNGGAATQLGNSRATEGPPSVS